MDVMLERLLGVRRGETVGQVLERHRGVGPGFDLLRILLSYYIFYEHNLWLSARPIIASVSAGPAGDGFAGWTRPIHLAAVPLFFALSGFLVMGSAFRLRATSTFLANRALRIFPALVVEVLLCAVVLGGSLTTLPLAQYFSSGQFFRYMGNMAGFITFHLPGVFEKNPVSGIVNANLFTLPSEFHCYLIAAALMASGLLFKRKLYTVVFFVVSAVGAVFNIFGDFVTATFVYPDYIFVYYFFVGVLFFHWQKEIPANFFLFILCCGMSYTLLLSQHTVFITPVIMVYCIIFFGLIAIPKLPIIGTGDYSYGVYLYGFPITQALVAIFPEFLIDHKFLCLFCSTIVTFSFAAFSWHVIEKRILPMKRHLPEKWFPSPKRGVIAQSPERRLTQAG